MKSIRKTLTRRLSIFISLFVVAVLLAVDLAIDSWIEEEFNRSVTNKLGLLMTLVSEDPEGVEFYFSGEYLPEFEGRGEPEYFQLWYKGTVFERSKTLKYYSNNDLPYHQPEFNQMVLKDTKLPDGRSGRVAYALFLPQIDSDDREEFKKHYQGLNYQQAPILIAYATSTEQLMFYLWFIDIAFACALIIVPLIIRFTVRNTVAYALTPLEALNNELKTVKFSIKRQKITAKEPVEELSPIIESLNHFIEENYSLYIREKRLTSDIAHELKTPVAELINLSEVAIKFPGDHEVEASFKPDVLKIGLRMKSIISSLLIMHKYSHQALDCSEKVNINSTIEKLVASHDSSRLIVSSSSDDCEYVLSNSFAIESILNNLINNALQYSPSDSDTKITISHLQDGRLNIIVRNRVLHTLSSSDLDEMFEPLWQKEASRTANNNFGLGLSISKVLALAINGSLSVSAKDEEIQFELVLNKPN